jgi:pyruvate dehydrogenase E2 component (dihydrolipoyllysine-residue acetyltransferase)
MTGTGSAGWRDATVPTSLGTISYSVIGDEGEAVVLLHSLGLARESWRPTAEPLADSPATVYAIDLPGHGDSPGPQLMLTIEDYARVTADFCAALGLQRVHLVGNSFGSVVAAEAAARFPELVASVVLVGCPAWQDREVREEWLHQRSELLLTADGDARAVTHELVEMMFPVLRDSYVDVVATGFAKAGTWIRNVMWALYAYDSTATFGRIAQPALVVYGQHDWLQATGPHLMAQLPDGAQVTIPGGAHMTPVNRPTELAAIVAGHLRSLSRTAAHVGSERG